MLHDLWHFTGRRRVAAALGADDAVDDGHADARQVAKRHAVQDVGARGMLRLVHNDKISGAADLLRALDILSQEPLFKCRGKCLGANRVTNSLLRRGAYLLQSFFNN